MSVLKSRIWMRRSCVWRRKVCGLIDRKARIGAGGHRIAFIHPSSTGGVLVELSEKAT